MFEWLVTLVNKFLRVFKSFVSEVFSHASKIIIAQLKDFAYETVKQLAVADLSNEKKRAEAFTAIGKEAMTRGIQIRSSLIYLIIEMCVSKLKQETE